MLPSPQLQQQLLHQTKHKQQKPNMLPLLQSLSENITPTMRTRVNLATPEHSALSVHTAAYFVGSEASAETGVVPKWRLVIGREDVHADLLHQVLHFGHLPAICFIRVFKRPNVQLQELQILL